MTRPVSSPLDRRLLRTSCLGILILLGNQLLLYGTNILLARWLGAEDLGDWSVAQALALLLANLAGLGTLQTLPRFLPLYLDDKHHGRLRGFMQDSIAAVLLASLVIAILGYGLFLVFWPSRLNHPVGLVWLAMPLIALGQFAGNTLLSAHRPLSSIIFTLLLWPALTLGLAAAFEFFEDDHLQDTEMLWAWVGGLLLMLPLMLLLTRKALPLDLFSSPAIRDRKQWIQAGAPLLVSGFIYMLLNQCALYVLEHIGAENAVGVFAVVNQTALFITLPMAAAYPVIVPHFPKLLADDDRPGLQRLLRNTMVGVGAAVTLITAGLLLFGETILAWFGPDFSQGYDALVAIALGNALIAILTPVWPLLAAAGHGKILVPATLAGLLTNAVICYALIPSLGSLAAAIGQSVGILGIYLYLIFVMKRKMGFSVW